MMRIITPPDSGVPTFDRQSLIQSKHAVETVTYPREALSQILHTYNQQIGNDQRASDNIRRLALPGSCCVVAGQQLGFMGGPSYTILKGISCLLVAKEIDAVPIFWLATEDHDIGEIDHTYTIDAKANLKRFRLPFPKTGCAVEDLVLTERHIEEMGAFYQFFKIGTYMLPTVGELYSTAMARILVQLFAGTGLVFLEPKSLRPLAVPFFSKEVTERDSIYTLLKNTQKRLEKEGKQVPLPIGEGPNLFVRNEEGKRMKIRHEGDFFVAGEERYSLQELLTQIAGQPERFSPNAIARPALQNTLLPVAASILGPTELAYHQQLTNYFSFHRIVSPLLIPRISANFIFTEAEAVLEKCQLNPWEPIPKRWPEPLETMGLPSYGLHLLNNLLHPHQYPQERVLNWWTFQSKTQEDLILSTLKQFSWNSSTSYYCYL